LCRSLQIQIVLRRGENRLKKIDGRVIWGIVEFIDQQNIRIRSLDDLDKKWGGNLIKQPYLLGIVYEELKDRPKSASAAK